MWVEPDAQSSVEDVGTQLAYATGEVDADPVSRADVDLLQPHLYVHLALWDVQFAKQRGHLCLHGCGGGDDQTVGPGVGSDVEQVAGLCACELLTVRLILAGRLEQRSLGAAQQDRKSTRLNSSHVANSYAVFA